MIKLAVGRDATPDFWDDNNKGNYAIFQRHFMNEYLFVEDARSFQAKVGLARKYHLRGMSVFALGFEDPAMWESVSSKS